MLTSPSDYVMYLIFLKPNGPFEAEVTRLGLIADILRNLMLKTAIYRWLGDLGAKQLFSE